MCTFPTMSQIKKPNVCMPQQLGLYSSFSHHSQCLVSDLHKPFYETQLAFLPAVI